MGSKKWQKWVEILNILNLMYGLKKKFGFQDQLFMKQQRNLV